MAKGGGILESPAKIGHDLHVSFEGGETLILRDFYLLGDAGEYSLLLDSFGQPIASGLSAPDVDYVQGAFTPILATEPAAGIEGMSGDDERDAVFSEETDAGVGGGAGDIPLWAIAGGAVLLGSQGFVETETSIAPDGEQPDVEVGVSRDIPGTQENHDPAHLLENGFSVTGLDVVLFQESAFPLISDMGEGL